MLRETEISRALEVAERIGQSVEEREFTSNKIKLTLSIGVAQLIDEDVSGLIKRADKMLYRSKENGRNKTSF